MVFLKIHNIFTVVFLQVYKNYRFIYLLLLYIFNPALPHHSLTSQFHITIFLMLETESFSISNLNTRTTLEQNFNNNNVNI